MHKSTWNKWREAEKPEDWKVLTKVEHTKRTAEYLALLEKENPRGMRRKAEDPTQLPPIARPAALSMAFEALPEDAAGKAEAKKKRKRRKPAKSDLTQNDPKRSQDSVGQKEDHVSDTGMADAPEETQPASVEPSTSKKKRKRRKSGKPNNNVDGAATDAAATQGDDEPSTKRRR